MVSTWYEKVIKALTVGIVLAVIALISAGWKSYQAIADMGRQIKKEVKQEMLEVRKNDMEWIQQRFNTLEVFTAGKVVSKQKGFNEDNP